MLISFVLVQLLEVWGGKEELDHRWETVAEWIIGRKEIGRFADDPCAACDRGRDGESFDRRNAAFEDRIENAGLAPDLSRCKFFIGIEACEFGASSGAAGRTVIGIAGAEHKIFRVGFLRIDGWAEGFNVVDLATIGPRDALIGERLFDGRCELGESGNLFTSHRGALVLDEEKPIAAPGNVAGDGAVARHLDGHGFSIAIRRDIVDRDRAIGIQMQGDRSDRGLDNIRTCGDASHVCESDTEPDRAMNAHVQGAIVVEINHATEILRVVWGKQQSPYHGIVATRFIRDTAAEPIKLFTEDLRLLRHGPATEVGDAIDDDAGRLTSRVGVNDLQFVLRILHRRRLSAVRSNATVKWESSVSNEDKSERELVL